MPSQFKLFQFKLKPFFLGLLATLFILSCQNNPVRQPTNSQPSDCRIVKHQMGETELCGKPQKVAALSPHVLDSMLALGVQPAAYAEVVNLNIQTYDNPVKQIPYLGKWVTTEPVGLGDRKNPSLERLALVEPDLILGEKWLSKEEYPFLTQIAPTLLFSDIGSDGEQFWQQDIEGIAKALGKTDRVKDLLAGFSQQIAQTKTALQPVLQKYPRIFLMTSNLTTYADSSPKSTTGRLLQAIGFEVVRPQGIEDDRKISWELTGSAIDDPMILARSNNNARTLSAILSIAGIGGVTGAVILTSWGGTKRRVNGMLVGFIGAGTAKTVFGLGQSLTIWLPAQFCSSLSFPLLESSETALWMEAVPPQLQGRVFAANSFVLELVSAIATLLSGLLSDRVLEPAMQSETILSSLFAPMFGHSAGAGMALLYVGCAIAMFAVGVIGFKLPQLNRLESTVSEQ